MKDIQDARGAIQRRSTPGARADSDWRGVALDAGSLRAGHCASRTGGSAHSRTGGTSSGHGCASRHRCASHHRAQADGKTGRYRVAKSY